MNSTTLLTYLIACVFIICAPGPSVTFLITTSVEQGKNSAYRIIPGTFLGDLSAMILSFIGVGALIHSVPSFEIVLKYVGGALLIYLGALKIYQRNKENKENNKLFLSGFLLTFFNPKTIIFFASFIPQFVNKNENIALQFFILGTLYLVVGLINDFTYATFAHYLGKLLGQKISRMAIIFGGGFLILSGILIVLK